MKMRDGHDGVRALTAIVRPPEVSGFEKPSVVPGSGIAAPRWRVFLVIADGCGIGNGQTHNIVLSENW